MKTRVPGAFNDKSLWILQKLFSTWNEYLLMMQHLCQLDDKNNGPPYSSFFTHLSRLMLTQSGSTNTCCHKYPLTWLQRCESSRRLPSNALPGVKFQHLIEIGLRQKSLRNLEGKKIYICRKSRYWFFRLQCLIRRSRARYMLR